MAVEDLKPIARGEGADQDGRPQQDSNLRTRLRRPVLYPLSYGGPVTPKGYQSYGIVWDIAAALGK